MANQGYLLPVCKRAPSVAFPKCVPVFKDLHTMDLEQVWCQQCHTELKQAFGDRHQFMGWMARSKYQREPAPEDEE